jgi:polysaccharide export outer membrane protein
MNRRILFILLLSTNSVFWIVRLSQATEATLPRAKDAAGHVIPSNPRNIPFKFVDGVPEYVIGVEDALEITLHRVGGDVVEKVSVKPNGTISFSFLYDIQAAGLTPLEMTKALTQTLSRYIRTPRVELKVAEYRSKRIYVLGAIGSTATGITGLRLGPGIYPLKGFTTALAQILDAGGPATGARLDEVRLTRGGKNYVLNLQRAITVGDRSQDVVLETDDALFLPGPGQGQGLVFVLGEVNTPGIKPLERPYLLDVLTASGGFTPNAWEGRVHVIRLGDTPHHPTIFSVNARRLYRGDLSQNLRLEDGDIVNVSKDVLADVNQVLAQVNPILQALTLPATAVSAYTTAFGILPVLQARNIALQAQTVELLGGGGIPGIPGGGGTIPPTTTPSPKPAAPEKKE